MERFAVKRGVEKAIGGNAGLAKKATEFFENINVDGDGVFTGSFGILSMVQGQYDGGKLVVEVEQMKGSDLSDFLESDGGREKAMESRKRWSQFLDECTGYSAKQRGEKAKEDTKKISKAKSTIKLALKSMDMSTKMTEEDKDAIRAQIAKIEGILANGDIPSEGQTDKLGKMI